MMPVNVGPCAVNRWPDLVMTHAVRAANLTATADADSHSRRCSNRKQLLLDMQRRSARHWARLQLGTLPGDENTELCTRWNTGQVDAASVASAADAMPELPEEVVNTDPENSNAEDGENRQTVRDGEWSKLESSTANFYWFPYNRGGGLKRKEHTGGEGEVAWAWHWHGGTLLNAVGALSERSHRLLKQDVTGSDGIDDKDCGSARKTRGTAGTGRHGDETVVRNLVQRHCWTGLPVYPSRDPRPPLAVDRATLGSNDTEIVTGQVACHLAAPASKPIGEMLELSGWMDVACSDL
ncbi:hypothetical protein AK812_SmicGene36345 [Symbiodinium microadriaticum]|uniref:Uncharacterized protein n=1 Tax=Symbiodinium microadriaticum TaxID=2951 RepID=A0A1Q9CJ41_SYMMI|nr:hypothetical protein AK812_SmicGene36345 [Symbiodinium microadriaticum]